MKNKDLLLAFVKLNSLIHKEFCTLNSELGFSPIQCKFLLVFQREISKNGELTLSQVEKNNKAPKSTLSELLTSMENEGLIVKTKSKIDKRVNKIEITEKGEEVLKKIEHNHDIIKERLEKVLTKEEIKLSKEVIEKLIGEFKEENEC